MRRYLRNLPIKRKLMALTMAISGAALLLACTVFAFYEQAAFRRTMARDFAILAAIFDDNVASGLAFKDRASMEQTLKTLGANPRIVAACVYDNQGAVVATYRRAMPAGGGEFKFPPAEPTRQRWGAERLDTFQDITLAGETIGVVYLGADLSELRERAWRYVVMVGVLLVGCSLVALLLAARLQRIISHPIVDLAQTVATVTAGKNYAARAHKESDDELGRLIDGFNEMLAQIQARDTELKNARDRLEERVEERTRELRLENAERKRAEESLRLLSSAVEQSREAVVITDGQLDLPGPRILFVNAAFTQLTGYTAEEVIGKTPRILQGPGTDRAVLRRLRLNLEHGEAFAGETVNSRKDGTTYHQEWQVAPIRDAAGAITHYVAIMRDITARKQSEDALEKANSELLGVSRQAGMAEVATGVLHNVGNVLNSVNVSATLVADQVRHTKAGNVAKLATLFEQNKADLAGFLTNDSRGRMIPAYLGTLAESLAAEHTAMLTEIEQLRKNIEHIKEIVSMQQSYSRASGVTETISVPDMVEDAIRINAGSLARHDVDAVRDYQARPVVTTDKHKVMQILINLIRNAKYACDESGRTDKLLTIRVTGDERGVKIAIIDNGVGIPAENLTRIFNHGFTTRATGHGFGLHSAALAAKELGGALTVHSDGPGHGATFTLELPYKPEGSRP